MNFGIHKVCLVQAEVVIKWGDGEAVPVCETVTVTGVEVCHMHEIWWPMCQQAR